MFIGGTRSSFPILGSMAALLVVGSTTTAGPTQGASREPTRGVDQPAPWLRVLKGEDAHKVAMLETKLHDLEKAGGFAEALEIARQILAIRRRAQGEEHWETVDAQYRVRTCERVAPLAREIQTRLAAAAAQAEEGEKLHDKGRDAQAEPLFRQVVEARREILGEDFPDMAVAYNELGSALMNQGEYAEAESVLQKSLAIRRRLLGEDHPATALGYSELGSLFNAQGRYDDVEDMFRKALAVRRRILGENHPKTAASYNSLAALLNHLGKCALAEPLLRKALATKLQTIGENDESTAASYNNLAFCLDQLAKYTEAEGHHQKTLKICRRLKGEDYPKTALAHHNLGWNLELQGRYVEAHAEFLAALKTFEKLRGEGNPETAYVYNTIATNLRHQKRYAEAEAFFQKSMGIRRRVFGENNPYTAQSYSGLAADYNDQGKYAQAEPLLRDALAILVRVFGPDHPHTAALSTGLTLNLNALGRYAEAETIAVAAVRGFENGRLQIGSAGLDRALFTTEASPLPLLAALQARLGKFEEAWGRWEATLARGLFDDLSARRNRPLSTDETKRQDEYLDRLNRLDNRIAVLAARKEMTQEARGRLDALEIERLEAKNQLVQFEADLVKKYQVSAGAVYPFDRIQPSIPIEAALVGWLDLKTKSSPADPRGDHWACVVRREGPPVWIKLTGTGTDGAWTESDEQRPDVARKLLGDPSAEPVGKALEELARQRLGPLDVALAARGGLPAVDHLIILPSPSVAGVPIEPLLEARPPGLPRYLVTYAPSGTIFAWLWERRREAKGKEGSPRRLLALGDPIPAPASRPSAPAGAVVAARDVELLLHPSRGESFTPIPGTRREVQAIAALFEQKDVFLGGEASEATLADLRSRGVLAHFTVIHLATHGKMDDHTPMNSRLLLSQDRLPDPMDPAALDRPFQDGALTAGEVMNTWKLDAELVTLSACQSGLGRDGGGEGSIGFAQAFLLAGGRGLILSMWEVDDRATSLLMTRFYENWLGKRKGLNKGRSKAEALREAKDWLRGLTSDMVDQELDQISRAPARARHGKPVAARPFEHPHYWAGFILMGDPM